ncbi:MAG TPA: YlmH/Sll1252 family protein [Clostridia bacterium]|nr:YlmH/Sll1252 family protein [Clostridia bacterium]
MPRKKEVEAFMSRQKHITHSKDDVYEILKVLSAYESISRGKDVGISGIISRSRFNLVESLVRAAGDNEVMISFEGGYPDAERGRTIFSIHEKISTEESGLSVIEIKLNSKVGHRDILGALLSLGVKRTMVGDIGIDGFVSYVIVSDDMVDFITSNLNRVGRASIESSKVLSCGKLNMPKKRFNDKEIVVSSMRSDLILSKLFKRSRKDVKGDIEKGKVKLNDFMLNAANHCVAETDVVSYKGNGKIKIGEIKGITKKGNYVLKIKKYV